MVFVKGCPLRCQWCHNPESQRPVPELLYYPTKCSNFRKCLEICPLGALTEAGGKIQIDRSLCNNCGDCSQACPTGALKIVGEWMGLDPLLAKIKKDLPFYQTSGGGVTISGGEPASQPEFVAQLLRECQRNAIHTAIETCGYVKWEVLSHILNYTNLVLYDLKVMDPEKHKAFTGVSNELIVHNAQRLAQQRIPTIIRVPVVPGYTASNENLEAIARFAATLNSVEEIHLLPYHRLGEAKYQKLDREYKLEGIAPLREEELETLAHLVESYGFRVQIGG